MTLTTPTENKTVGSHFANATRSSEANRCIIHCGASNATQSGDLSLGESLVMAPAHARTLTRTDTRGGGGEEETLEGRVGSSRHALCVCLGETQTGFRGNQWSFFGENLLKFLVFDLRQNFSKMNFKALRLAWVTVQDQSSPRQAKLLTGEFRRKYR